jgi:hypothetical protein
MATLAEFQAAEPEMAVAAFPKPPEMFFAHVERADRAWWENVGQPGTYPVRQRWEAPRD